MLRFANLTIGADPEVFVRKNGLFVSAHSFPCGDKHMPMKTKNGAIQVDGLALEFNTKPTDSPEFFVKNVRALLEDLNIVVKTADPDMELVACPVADFSSEYLQSLPPYALELGCEPDYDAYTGKANYPPDASLPFRTGSGHIHFGWVGKKRPNKTEHFKLCQSLARELDFYLGLPSLSWDSDNRRRELYGKAGAFRPTSYGLEYRTLSNAWLKEDKTIELVFQQAKKGFYSWIAGMDTKSLLQDKYGNFAQAAIDNSLVDWRTQQPELAHVIEQR